MENNKPESNFSKYFNYWFTAILFGISYLFFTKPGKEIECCVFYSTIVLFNIMYEIIKSRK